MRVQQRYTMTVQQIQYHDAFLVVLLNFNNEGNNMINGSAGLTHLGVPEGHEPLAEGCYRVSPSAESDTGHAHLNYQPGHKQFMAWADDEGGDS